MSPIDSVINVRVQVMTSPKMMSVQWLLITLSLLLAIISSSALVGPTDGSYNVCSYNSFSTVANCSSRRLTRVPWGLHGNILTLDLNNNNILVLVDKSFNNYKYIGQLLLRNNSLESIEKSAFFNLASLRVLDLSNNLLEAVPITSLQVVKKSLKQLVLSNNKISTIPKDSFSQLNNLQHLDLSGNSITEIMPGALASLHSMEFFKLNRNSLESLPQNAFDAFPVDSISQVQLYGNLWFCDCRLRWLQRWFNATDSSVWDSPGYPVRCDGPTKVRDKLFSSLQLDELACEIQMKSSSSTLNLPEGANETLFCKYSSYPDAEARWFINSKLLDTAKKPQKYNIETYATEKYPGQRTQISKLRIQNFRYEDIARYECFVENIRGKGSTEYRLTLEGVDFDLVTPASSNSGDAESAKVDTRSVIIAVAVVSGIILIIVIGVLIFCSVNRMQRKKQEKQEMIRENVKQHFINNSEIIAPDDMDISKLSNGTPGKPPLEEHVDGRHDDDHGSNSDRTNDSKLSTIKRPLGHDESEPLYIFEQPGSPFTNGNTYVSFGSELTDPAEEYSPPLYHTPQPPPHHGYPSRHPSARYESSHAGSATPLLDRNTPSVFDSDDPVEDYAQYPVYDSVTNSLQHPSHNPIHSNGDSNGGFYTLVNTSSPAHRNDSASSYGSGTHDPAKRLSSFHYPPSINGSMPRTPGSTRSTMALAPGQIPVDIYGTSPRYDTADIYSHPNRNGGPDIYGYHRPVPINPADYPVSRDRYPGTLTLPRMTPDQKSMSVSVGNLGFSPLSTSGPSPVGTGPRKPPRLHQSREYMELTPQEMSIGGGSDYITSPEAQQYSQSYGITPGTPV